MQQLSLQLLISKMKDLVEFAIISLLVIFLPIPQILHPNKHQLLPVQIIRLNLVHLTQFTKISNWLKDREAAVLGIVFQIEKKFWRVVVFKECLSKQASRILLISTDKPIYQTVHITILSLQGRKV